MNFKERDFIPVLFGGDINTYSVARAFYEEYQVKSYVLGKYMSGPSCYSNITNYMNNPKMDREEVMMEYIKKLSKKHSDKTVLAIGCGDSYVEMLSIIKDRLPKNVIAPYIPHDLMEQLIMKENFYQLCEKHGIDYPATLVYSRDMGSDVDVKFTYPVILKPSNGVDYFHHPFEGQNKIYKLNSLEEVKKTIEDIYASGYSDKLIIQDMIPGNDEYMRVLTCYSDKNANVKMMCLGHVLLEEHTPLGLGNHACIITEPNDEIMSKVKALLEELHYTGFSNFDIKYDSRDGKYKFFEINCRQGRSNFYVTNSGFNVARYFVEDYVYNKELEFKTAQDEYLWMVVPKAVAFKYVTDPDMKKRMRRLIKEGKMVNPIFMKGDLQMKRYLRMVKNHFRQFSNYKKYYK